MLLYPCCILYSTVVEYRYRLCTTVHRTVIVENQHNLFACFILLASAKMPPKPPPSQAGKFKPRKPPPSKKGRGSDNNNATAAIGGGSSSAGADSNATGIVASAAATATYLDSGSAVGASGSGGRTGGRGGGRGSGRGNRGGRGGGRGPRAPVPMGQAFFTAAAPREGSKVASRSRAGGGNAEWDNTGGATKRQDAINSIRAIGNVNRNNDALSPQEEIVGTLDGVIGGPTPLKTPSSILGGTNDAAADYYAEEDANADVEANNLNKKNNSSNNDANFCEFMYDSSSSDDEVVEPVVSKKHAVQTESNRSRKSTPLQKWQQQQSPSSTIRERENNNGMLQPIQLPLSAVAEYQQSTVSSINTASDKVPTSPISTYGSRMIDHIASTRQSNVLLPFAGVDDKVALQKEADSWFLIQLPTRLPKLKYENRTESEQSASNVLTDDTIADNNEGSTDAKVRSSSGVVIGTAETATKPTDTDSFDHVLQHCPDGRIGKIQIHKSGKMVLVWQRGGSNGPKDDDLHMNLTEGMSCKFAQQVVTIDPDTAEYSHLGSLYKTLIATPNIDDLTL